MTINYDANGRPEMSAALAEFASQANQQIAHVICDEPGAQVGDEGGVSFLTAVPEVPRSGEKIQLEDGSMCTVVNVIYRVAMFDGITMLVPNVYCVQGEQGGAA